MKILALAIVMLSGMIASCTRTVYTPVETVRTEKDEVTRWRVDTVTQGDTRLIYIRGDTIIDRRDRWRERRTIIRDTIYIERTDTIARPYPVEKKLTRWQQTKQDWGGLALVGLAAVGALALIYLRRRH